MWHLQAGRRGAQKQRLFFLHRISILTYANLPTHKEVSPAVWHPQTGQRAGSLSGLPCPSLQSRPSWHLHRVGQNPIYIYIRCINSIFGREINKYAVTYGVYLLSYGQRICSHVRCIYVVMYGVYLRFWPTLHLHQGRAARV